MHLGLGYFWRWTDAKTQTSPSVASKGRLELEVLTLIRRPNKGD